MEDMDIMQEVVSVPQERPDSSVAGAEPASADPADQTTAEDTKPAGETDPDGEEGQPADGVESPGMIQLRYMHEDRNVTLDQARELAQKGLKLDGMAKKYAMPIDQMSSVLDRLRFLAAASDKASLDELTQGLLAQHNQKLYQSLLSECEGNESIAKRLYDAEIEKQQKKYEGVLAAAKNEEEAASQRLTKRLADEFTQLQEMFPQLTAFDKVPRAVVDTAVRQNIPLTDAYLRYQYAQDQRTKEAKASSDAASKASIGAISSAPADADPALEAARRGVWS